MKKGKDNRGENIAISVSKDIGERIRVIARTQVKPESQVSEQLLLLGLEAYLAGRRDKINAPPEAGGHKGAG